MSESKENSNPHCIPTKGSKNDSSGADEDAADYHEESSASSVELTIDEVAGPSSKRRRRRIKTNEANKQFVSEGLEEFEEEIERQLGSKAKKSKLTINNVKNILKHVITNHHVLAMVKQSMKDDGEEGGSSDGENCPYEPKLTRAKTKELMATQATMTWPVTPVKVPPGSATKKMIDEVHEDSSDDEEYQPNEEETENSDDECNSSLASDVDQTLTPTPSTPRSNNDCSTQTLWTDDGLFKMPNTNFELMETMGMRTRSKVSYTDIALEDIEQSFIPPDITTDMYEMVCDNEDWKQFLNEFVQPLNKISEVQDDDEADPEYNILEDEEAEDKEEMRADRAVKVSKKELNELITELMEYMEPSDDENDADASGINTTNQHEESTAAPSTPTVSIVGNPQISPKVLQVISQSPKQAQVQFLVPAVPPPRTSAPVLISSPVQKVAIVSQPAATPHVHVEFTQEVPLFTRDQRLLLNQQMMQHTQLLTQNYLQSTIFPEFQACAAEMREDLIALHLLGGTNPRSAFYAQNLNLSINTVKEWEEIIDSEKGKAEISKFYNEEVKRYVKHRDKKLRYRPHLNSSFLKIVSTGKAFVYPTLLPHCGFKPYIGVLRNNTYLPSEDWLIATALDQFLLLLEEGNNWVSKNERKLNLNGACKYLSELLLPVKTCSSIENRIKLVKNSLPDHPITLYLKTREPPILVHRVFTAKFISPAEQPSNLLPFVWKAFIHRQFD